MYQKTFNDYQHATTIASVKLINELLNDISEGNRMPKLNGHPVLLREKLIASYTLDRYSIIIQEYTLTDNSGLDDNFKLADNRLTRDEMKQLLQAINLISSLGLNSSEDFVLDRVTILPEIAISSLNAIRIEGGVKYVITATTNTPAPEEISVNFTIANPGGLGGSVGVVLTLLAGATSVSDSVDYVNSTLTSAYDASVTLVSLIPESIFSIVNSTDIPVTVPDISVSQVSITAELNTRTANDTEFTITVATSLNVASNTTFIVDTTNAFGAGGSTSENVLVLAGANSGAVIINSGSAIFESYVAEFNLSTPPPAGFEIGVGQALVPVSAIALNITNLTASVLERAAGTTSFTIFITTASNVDTNTTFVVSVVNAFGLGASTNESILVLAGSNSGSKIITSNSALSSGYQAVFTLPSVPDPIFEIGIGLVSLNVSAIALNIVSVVATTLIRTPATTTLRLVFTTVSNVTTENTVSVLVTNPYGLGGAEAVNGVIPNGSNTVTVDISSNNALGSAYTATFAFIIPLQVGLGEGSITPSLNLSAFALWELDSFSNSTSGFLDLNNTPTTPNGLWVSDDGTFLFVVGAVNTIYRYNLSTPYDITTGVYASQSFNPIDAGASIRGVSFNNNGTKMFVTGSDSSGFLDEGVFEYDLSGAYDVTTAVYSNTFLDVPASGFIPDCVFSNDGSKIYVLLDDEKAIDQFVLTTPFDLSSSQPKTRLSISGDLIGSFIGSIDFGKNGERLYVADGNDRILQYNLSVAYDITTAVVTKNLDSQGFNGGSLSLTVRSIKLNSLGDRMYIVDDNITGDEFIYQVLI